ncbi:helix-turn-helix domain-containing protein [Fischerella thermalis]|uniref:helix-turn-helix domain-containing protein n=1 Tax=Fischerella thermalis TaxID=372787 RepID=UPI00242FC674|nr:AraC family transcriptional regulator [Fischerella thermalis]
MESIKLIPDPFLKSLPGFMHIQVSSEPTAPLLKTGIQHIIQEANCIQPGSLCLLTRLVELMFIEILRNYMQNSPNEQMGGVLALNDPIVGQVLNWMHADPAHPWTVSELAKQVNVSRSALATRFTELLGQPPMQYLTQWRLQLAAHHLRNTDESIAKIASQVGYESEAAFNRAFKRYVGKPPGVWRHHLSSEHITYTHASGYIHTDQPSSPTAKVSSGRYDRNAARRLDTVRYTVLLACDLRATWRQQIPLRLIQRCELNFAKFLSPLRGDQESKA